MPDNAEREAPAMSPKPDPLYLQITELAAAIEGQAGAIAGETLVGPLVSACKRILGNAETLVAWAQQYEGHDR